MKKRVLFALILLVLTGGFTSTSAQCNWEPLINDGFEYTSAIVGILPGTTVHTTPQTFAVHSGSTAAYLNFLNCNGGAGTCAGAKVFERVMGFCPGVPIRMNIWFATSFSGVQCDIKIVISDENGTVLDSVPSLLPGYAPAWTNYISSTLTPSTDSIIFSIYTNIDGSPGGNDLAIDDYKLEHCVITHTSAVAGICNNVSSTDLFSTIANSPVNTGTWAGPSVLGNGYLGTFTNGVNTGGQYIYTSYPYGTAMYCPVRKDTIIAFAVNAPVVNLGNDTTLCTNQSIILTTGTSGNNTYLWSTGITTPVLGVPAPGGTGGTSSYSVVVTNNFGCVDQDTININYVVCSGTGELETAGIQLFPNPAAEQITLQIPETVQGHLGAIVYDMAGRLLLNSTIFPGNNTISVKPLPKGVYILTVNSEGISIASSRLIVID